MKFYIGKEHKYTYTLHETLFVSQQLQHDGGGGGDGDADDYNDNNDMSKAHMCKCLLHIQQQPCHSSALDNSNPLGCYNTLTGK